MWKIQSGIAPPLFYLIVAEKEKLKSLKLSLKENLKRLKLSLRDLLCPKTQNTVEPIVQSTRMYAINP